MATLDKGAALDCHVLSLYGGIISNKLHAVMNHPGAVCRMDGLYLADGEQQIHYDISVVHNAPECYSRQLFKGFWIITPGFIQWSDKSGAGGTENRGLSGKS